MLFFLNFFVFFFFFKQKTAYEMRISDWSSDVCSSDLSCAQKGDERSKEFIYKQCYGYVRAITMRYVRNEYDAEELTNESFMRAFGKIVSFSSNDSGERFEKSFRAWLARIAVNISIDFLRAQKQFVALEIGRAWCRERVCRYVWISVVAV